MISTRIAEGVDPASFDDGHDERVMIRHYLRINEEQSAGKATGHYQIKGPTAVANNLENFTSKN